MDLKDYIRGIPDFPKPGIQFKDITPLLASPEAFDETIRLMMRHYEGRVIDAISAAEARGGPAEAPGSTTQGGCARRRRSAMRCTGQDITLVIQ